MYVGGRGAGSMSEQNAIKEKYKRFILERLECSHAKASTLF